MRRRTNTRLGQRLRPTPEASERGVVAVITAIMMVVLLGMAAFAIDVGHLYAVRADLQTAADAAALAAAEELPHAGTVIKTARQYGTLNYPEPGIVVTGSDVVLGSWDTETRTFFPNVSPRNAVQVTARRSAVNANPVELWFAPVLGIDEADVEAIAIAFRSGGTHTRFLIDDEMFDTDIPVIEQLAASLGVSSADLLADSDGDWFIDLYDLAGPVVLELPTGQVGDEALFDIDHPQFAFSTNSNPSFEDFLNYNEDGSWRNNLLPNSLLDPLLGVSRVNDAGQYWSYVNPNFLHVSPVYKSDVSALNPVDGVPAVNALGLRRGLVAFRVIGVGSDPDGPGGSVLPNLVIKIVDPHSISLGDVAPGQPGKVELVG